MLPSFRRFVLQYNRCRKHSLLYAFEVYSRMGHENETACYLEEEHYSHKKTYELSYTSS